MASSRKFDVVVFGASGFTGKFVVKHLVNLKSTNAEKFTFAIAGRSISKLQDVLSEANTGDSKIECITADVSMENSLKEMARSARVIINCVGPYRYHGEKVVKACIDEATDYVDISGEPEYNDLARKNNVAIVSACGFDSVPADLGVQFTSNAFPASYQPSSIESFIEVQCGPQGSTIHATTYECIILGVASLEKTKQVRKAINYPKLPYSDPKLIIRNIPYFESRVGMYSMPFMGSDASVVKRTQIMLSQTEKNFQPVQYAAYITTKSILDVIGMMIFGIFIFIFARFEKAQKWLINHPELVTFGKFTKNGPTQEQLRDTTTKLTFFAQGSSIDNPKKRMNLKAVFVGPDPGYTLTSITVSQAALCLLKGKKLTGILTPGAAFYKTDYIERLARHGIKMTVVDRKEYDL